MKKTPLALLALISIVGIGSLLAQSPTPTPTPTPTPPIIQITAQQRAAIIAVSMENQILYLDTSIQKTLSSGVPATPTMPAVTGAQIQAALGQAVINQIQAAHAALLANQATPTPTPAPTPSPTPSP